MNDFARARPRPVAPRSLHARALEDLRSIRATMERAAAFTALPGWGGVLMGLTALSAAPLAHSMTSRGAWLGTWLAAATVAGLFGVIDMRRRARLDGTTLLSPAGSRFARALLPGFIAGAALTGILWRVGEHVLVPGVWLLLYGVAVHGAGAFSIRAVRQTGLCFMGLGFAAFATPESWSDAWMAAGFGGLHVITGLRIARSKRGTEAS